MEEGTHSEVDAAKVELLRSIMAVHKCEVPSLYTSDTTEVTHGERWLVALDAWEVLTRDTPLDRPLRVIDEIYYLWPNELQKFVQKIASREWSFALARELIQVRIEMESKDTTEHERVRLMIRSMEAFKAMEAEKVAQACRVLQAAGVADSGVPVEEEDQAAGIARSGVPVEEEDQAAGVADSGVPAEEEDAPAPPLPVDPERAPEPVVAATAIVEETETEKVYDLARMENAAQAAVARMLERQHALDVQRATALLAQGKKRGKKTASKC
jgi:hypothetical protein